MFWILFFFFKLQWKLDRGHRVGTQHPRFKVHLCYRKTGPGPFIKSDTVPTTLLDKFWSFGKAIRCLWPCKNFPYFFTKVDVLIIKKECFFGVTTRLWNKTDKKVSLTEKSWGLAGPIVLQNLYHSSIKWWDVPKLL